MAGTGHQRFLRPATNHQQVVRTSSGDFEGAFDVFLALDLAEISLYQRVDLFHCQGRLWVDDHLTNKMLEKVSRELTGMTSRSGKIAASGASSAGT